MRGRAKKATTPLICTLGFKHIPRGDVEVRANVDLRHKLLGSTPADSYRRKLILHYKVRASRC